MRVTSLLAAVLMLAATLVAGPAATAATPTAAEGRQTQTAELKPKHKKKHKKKHRKKKKKSKPKKSKKPKKAKKPGKRPKKKVLAPTGALFNNPRGNRAERRRIVDQYLRLIDHAPRGAKVSLSMFHLSDPQVTDALLRAHARGAHVRVVLDHDSVGFGGGRGYRRLREGLGTSRKRRSWVLVCPRGRGCIASRRDLRGINHSKFLLLSRTYDSRDVVMQSSANMTRISAIEHQWNDALTIADKPLYDSYLGYFSDEANRRDKPKYFHTVRRGGHYGVLFFPRPNGVDPIVGFLDRVRCSRGATVRVSMGIFTRRELAAKLWEMDDRGCDVRATMSAFSPAVRNALLRRGGRHGGPTVRYFTGPSASRRYGHSKYLLVHGEFQGRWRRLLLAGSHSFTKAALRENDETEIATSDRRTFDAYWRNFGHVFGAARGRLAATSAAWRALPPLVPENAEDPG